MTRIVVERAVITPDNRLVLEGRVESEYRPTRVSARIMWQEGDGRGAWRETSTTRAGTRVAEDGSFTLVAVAPSDWCQGKQWCRALVWLAARAGPDIETLIVPVYAGTEYQALARQPVAALKWYPCKETRHQVECYLSGLPWGYGSITTPFGQALVRGSKTTLYLHNPAVGVPFPATLVLHRPPRSYRALLVYVPGKGLGLVEDWRLTFQAQVGKKPKAQPQPPPQPPAIKKKDVYNLLRKLYTERYGKKAFGWRPPLPA